MSKARILVVEDERIVALHLQQRLKLLGYDVTTPAASGVQALASVRDERPDLVLMDIHIEGPMDGIDTAREISRTSDTPVIYLTAYSEQATLERARATRPYGYLVKPFSERELHATIQMALERRDADLVVRQSEERLLLALEAADMASWELDATTKSVLHVGNSHRFFGHPQEVLAGAWDGFLALVHDEDRHQVDRVFSHTSDHGGLCSTEFRSVHPDGALHWLKIQGKLFTGNVDGKSRIIGVIQDITERRRTEVQLQQAAMVFESAQEGILILDRAFDVINFNRAYCTISGCQDDEIIGKFPHILDTSLGTPVDRRSMMTTLAAAGRWHGEILGRRRDNSLLPVLVNIASVCDAKGDVTHYVALFSDMTAIRQAQEQFQHLAHYDPLTDLPNRLLAMDRLQQAMNAAQRRNGTVALLFIDLDHFKRINDTLGHSIGDELLRTVAKRMRLAVRQEDTVARLGGDEFMVIVDRVEQPVCVAELSNRIIARICEPIALAGIELTVSASVGISLFPDDGLTQDDLIRAADTAMYVAKDDGRNRFAFYTKEMTRKATLYMERDRDLRRGFDMGELVLHYQPQIEMASGAVLGVEALIRWQHPTAGLLGPDAVIPISEKSGLIVPIGEWVLREACAQACAWRRAGLPPLRMAVNVSARQMNPDRLPQFLKTLLDETGLPAERLEIEITESTLQNEDDCLATLLQLKRLGLMVAIDDFGTGYSCMGSLKSLPIDRLKIDRGFIRDIPEDRDSEAITEAIIAMAHRLNRTVIAEGVETLAQQDFLRSHGCREGQGYLYARPMAAAAVAALLAERSGLAPDLP
ncbi:EAL domain-containing protein (plasmid) [Azospirillum melinis]|uniref:two-component system response regulator n=1 Tax=Azospirillum melinis TaxID=328839 RepID=UPI003756E45E